MMISFVMSRAALAALSIVAVAVFASFHHWAGVPSPMPAAYAGPPYQQHCPGFQGCLNGEGTH